MFGRVSRDTWRVADLVLFSNKMHWRIAARCWTWIVLTLLAPSFALASEAQPITQKNVPVKMRDGVVLRADVLLPAAAWAEKSGCWENFAGKIQPFEAAVAPPEGARREGDVYYKLLGRRGFYDAEEVRGEMGEPFASVKLAKEEMVEPAFEFAEL